MATTMNRSHRQRKYRERQRNGIKVVHLPIKYNPVVEALIVSGALTEAEAVDERKVETVLVEVIHHHARVWR